uniref:Uncharacterized protein n=1 Tax=Ditylenchus dipsaci TaxID=166011 RepID=A0A915DC94_9BILA
MGWIDDAKDAINSAGEQAAWPWALEPRDLLRRSSPRCVPLHNKMNEYSQLERARLFKSSTIYRAQFVRNQLKARGVAFDAQADREDLADLLKQTLRTHSPLVVQQTHQVSDGSHTFKGLVL